MDEAMRDPLGVAPSWSEEAFGASAVIDLRSPNANPQVSGITAYLDVCESEDEVDLEAEDNGADYSPSFSWRVSIDAEAAGFGDEQLDSGESPDLEQAKRDCWAAVVDYLRSDTYSDEEIIAAVD